MKETFKAGNVERFEKALERFDEENSHDPNTIDVNGTERARELIYAGWLSDWVLRLLPEASEELRLAARSQHLCRWMVPRASYPMTRVGYLSWREGLKKFHAQKAAEILTTLGYSEAQVARVSSLNLKKGLPHDLEAQTLEDALCLVFLERQFAELAQKTTEEKMLEVLRKTWSKMSPVARKHALYLSYGAREKSLIERALAGSK